MDDILKEIDNNIMKNMKNLSYVKYKKKIFQKMRSYRDIKTSPPKIFSASIINKKFKDNNKKLMLKSNSSIKCNTKNKYMNNTMSTFPKKMLFLKPRIDSYLKKSQKEDEKSSLSTLIKTNTSFFNTTNFNFNSDVKLSPINATNNSFNFTNNNINQTEPDIRHSLNISFNKHLTDFLNENKNYKNEDSCKKFIEALRIIRRAKYKNFEVKKQMNDIKDLNTEEINSLNKVIITTQKNKELFDIYNECLKHYLQELLNIKRKEKDKLEVLKSDIEDIKRSIVKKNISIKIFKDRIINLKEIKKFLLQVKYGQFIDQMPYEIQKEYGFYKERRKVKEKTMFQKISPKSIINSDTFKKKSYTLLLKKKKTQLYNIKRTSVSIKSEENYNKKIFDNAEQFMNCFNIKTEKIKKNISLYRKQQNSLNNFKFRNQEIILQNERYMQNFLPEESRLLKILDYQKKSNNILKDKLNNLKEINKSEQNSLKNIFSKLEKILLNIQSKIDINSFIHEKNFERFLSREKNEINNIDETIKLTKYILKIVEMLTEILINIKNNFKNNSKLKEFYRKVHIDIEQSNNVDRYKLQISLAIKKEKERHKRIHEKIYKTRIGALFKNGKKCFYEKIPEKILLKRKLTNKKERTYSNKYEEAEGLFSFG